MKEEEEELTKGAQLSVSGLGEERAGWREGGGELGLARESGPVREREGVGAGWAEVE